MGNITEGLLLVLPTGSTSGLFPSPRHINTTQWFGTADTMLRKFTFWLSYLTCHHLHVNSAPGLDFMCYFMFCLYGPGLCSDWGAGKYIGVTIWSYYQLLLGPVVVFCLWLKGWCTMWVLWYMVLLFNIATYAAFSGFRSLDGRRGHPSHLAIGPYEF